MNRLISWFLIACICHLCVGCSTLKTSSDSLLSKVGELFGEDKAEEANAVENPSVCLLSPPDPATLQSELGNGSCIQVPQTTHDFGRIKEEAVLVHDFKIVNKCSTELKIKSVKPG